MRIKTYSQDLHFLSTTKLCQKYTLKYNYNSLNLDIYIYWQLKK